MERWRAGDEQAAVELFDLFSRKLTLLAERHLNQRMASRVDGEDIVQSVFRTFFRRGRKGEFKIDGSGGLWRLLVKITLAKVRSQARWHRSNKRDVMAELSTGPDGLDLGLLARDPGPADVAMLVDLVRAVTEGLPETYAEILAQRLAGHTRSQIAENLGISRQTVYRALDVIRQRFESLSGDEEDGESEDGESESP